MWHDKNQSIFYASNLIERIVAIRKQWNDQSTMAIQSNTFADKTRMLADANIKATWINVQAYGRIESACGITTPMRGREKRKITWELQRAGKE